MMGLCHIDYLTISMLKNMMKLSCCVCSILLCLGAFASDTTSLRIYFPFNSYQLTAEAKLQLEDVLPLDSSIVLTSVKIIGHTDAVGSNAYNDRLSVQRAKAAARYLQEKGLAANLIQLVTGKGETELADAGHSEAADQLNRRVEILIEYNASVIEETVVIKSSKPAAKSPDTTGKTVKKQLEEGNVVPGQNIVLKNINFFGGRHHFLPGTTPYLEELVDIMHEFPTLEIEIQGHICCELGAGDGLDLETHTKDLSVRRAKAVYDYLTEHGIAASRMQYKGYGRAFPIIPEETTEQERMINRRVEIKIIKK